jgi:hypothetical protein
LAAGGFEQLHEDSDAAEAKKFIATATDLLGKLPDSKSGK